METQSVPRTLVTRRELADLLRVNTSTIDRWRRRGLIRPVQFARGGAVRFKAEDVELRRAEEVGLLHEPAEHLALGYISVSTLTPIVVVLLALERAKASRPTHGSSATPRASPSWSSTASLALPPSAATGGGTLSGYQQALAQAERNAWVEVDRSGGMEWRIRLGVRAKQALQGTPERGSAGA